MTAYVPWSDIALPENTSEYQYAPRGAVMFVHMRQIGAHQAKSHPISSCSLIICRNWFIWEHLMSAMTECVS